jgi:hypothetical protein
MQRKSKGADRKGRSKEETREDGSWFPDPRALLKEREEINQN